MHCAHIPLILEAWTASANGLTETDRQAGRHDRQARHAQRVHQEGGRVHRPGRWQEAHGDCQVGI